MTYARWLAVLGVALAACSDDPPAMDSAPADTAADTAPDAADTGPADTGADTADTTQPMDTTPPPMDVEDVTDAMDAADAADAVDAADTTAAMDTAEAAPPCPDGSLSPDGACVTCAPGERVCSGMCARPTDPAFGCAGPGCTPCSFPNATATCTAGACAFERCAMGFTDCNTMARDGCEVNTGNDPMNCGSCGRRCMAPNAMASCVAGVCGVGTCNAGFGDCDMNPTNGCETDTRANVMNCGGCGMACMPARGSGACSAGVCSVASCMAGFGDCNRMGSDGCETNTNTEVMHCGACARPCMLAHATARCEAGTCRVMACDENFGDCDGNAANGCETDFRISNRHCGACGNDCAAPNAVTSCSAGTCRLTTCNAGFTNCDGDFGTGCETQTSSDPFNCGACGAACRTPNATPLCAAGNCRVGTCEGGFGDCNGTITDGCETRLTTVENCGRCRTVCRVANAIPVCRDDICQVGACTAPFSDCNGAVTDGCEANLLTDPRNCGGCALTCGVVHATPRCASGVCDYEGACELGFADCNSDRRDGCETNTRTDPMNCSRCGNTCVGACVDGSCRG
ncbi:MAG: hypothetical protein HY909_00540 [Deltaproteobacteria bacterium]|nr:hypothetical protein [Deltaproteobacteria bacterium]